MAFSLIDEMLFYSSNQQFLSVTSVALAANGISLLTPLLEDLQVEGSEKLLEVVGFKKNIIEKLLKDITFYI